jgi:chemotaxis protein MotB
MAGRRGTGRRRRGVPAGGHGDDERWLLTYADMITLLMALFMVLFSISSVNVSKYKSLSKSLNSAFDGKQMSGGESILDNGASPNAPTSQETPSISPTAQPKPDKGKHEEDELHKLQQRIQAYAQSHGLKNSLQARVSRRGLVVRLLTDNVLFDSGDARLKPGAYSLLIAISGLLETEVHRPTVVEGHTDNVPISGGTYPSNWELSTARATSVVRFLIDHGARAWRLSAAGYANTKPIASNDSSSGRHRNRRVEIVVLRRGADQGGKSS